MIILVRFYVSVRQHFRGGIIMKKSLTKILAVILCFTLVFSMAVPAFAAVTEESVTTVEEYVEHVEKMEKKASFLSKLLQFLINDVVLKAISIIIPNFSFVEEYGKEKADDTFLSGTKKFIDTNSDKYVWKVGYSQRSIIPDDFGKILKYARGSYCPWGYSTEMYQDEDGNDEDLKVRTVILDDKTGRGSVVFASVDCIGLSNADVQKIRAAVIDFAKKNNIVSINISAIHTHMSIDSQGVWNSPLLTFANNLASLGGLTTVKFGVNEDYLNTIINRTKETIVEAYTNMKEGTMSYATVDLPKYVRDRTTPSACDSGLHRLMFTPIDKSAGTVIASFGCHPEVTSYGNEFDTKLSADFIYYMEKVINKSGNNFIFIQGNVGTNAGIYGPVEDGLDPDMHQKAMRFGYELGYICLTMSKSKEERILVNDQLGDLLGVNKYKNLENYTAWYEGLPVVNETPVEAVLNIRSKKLTLEIENSTAKILLKLGLASNEISYDYASKKYYSQTEFGYAEFGSALKVLMSPGEIYGEILMGGKGIEGFGYSSLRELFGDNVIVFDLMNDAAGYICPDNTYSVVGYRYNENSDELESDSWCLTVSIGKNTASKLVQGYIDLVKEVR